jgi:ketosteroid isomerase-like protein
MADEAGTSEIEIRELLDKMGAAFERGDWSEYQTCWAHESFVQLLHPSFPEWLVGWPEIESVLRARILGRPKVSAIRTSLRIRVADLGGMAWATSASELTIGEEGAKLRLWHTTVFERQPSGWRVVHGHVSVPEDLQEGAA